MKTYKVNYKDFAGNTITFQTYHNVTAEVLFKAVITGMAFTDAVSFQAFEGEKDVTDALLHFVYNDIKDVIAENIKTAANSLWS